MSVRSANVMFGGDLVGVKSNSRVLLTSKLISVLKSSAMARSLILIVAAWAIFTISKSYCQELTQVTISLGTLQGAVRTTPTGQKYFAFEGIPYGKPPVGKHRFKQSIPVEPWIGIWNATELPNRCLQEVMPGVAPNLKGMIIGSEDCLYLNVYTPKLPSDSADGKLLDVVFYIHGGAFRAGWGEMNGPEYIMDRNVVYVNINYRLAILGFFSLEDNTCPGNNGLKDQNLALKWVNQHIASFGGNPNKITIMGTSAGGASVHYHLLSPLSKGLFHKAISNSGAIMNPWALTNQPREKSLIVAKSLGCSSNNSADILDCLRQRPAERIVKALNKLTVFGTYIPLDPLGPIIEKPGPNAFIAQQPIDVILSKVINDVPTIFSFTNDEGAFMGLPYAANEPITQKVENEWDTLIPHLLNFVEVIDPAKKMEASQLIRKHYLGDKKIIDAIPEFIRAFSDRYFLNGIHQAAILHAQNQASPIYSYRFSYTNPLIPAFGNYSHLPYKGGSPHGSDATFVLKSSFATAVDYRDYPETAEMSKTMIDYYMKFIAENPVPGWDSVKTGLPEFKFLDVQSPDPSKNSIKTETPRGEFWDGLKLKENWSENMKWSSQLHSEF